MEDNRTPPGRIGGAAGCATTYPRGPARAIRARLGLRLRRLGQRRGLRHPPRKASRPRGALGAGSRRTEIAAALAVHPGSEGGHIVGCRRIHRRRGQRTTRGRRRRTRRARLRISAALAVLPRNEGRNGGPTLRLERRRGVIRSGRRRISPAPLPRSISLAQKQPFEGHNSFASRRRNHIHRQRESARRNGDTDTNSSHRKLPPPASKRGGRKS